MTTLVRSTNRFLELISGDEKIVIGETNGDVTIAIAGAVFDGWLDPDFRKDKINVKGQPTKDTVVQVFELIKDAKITDVLGGFGKNLDYLVLTQHQIVEFVRDNKKTWIHGDGWVTCFLFKTRDEFLLARVCRFDQVFDVYVSNLSCDYVWPASHRSRFVVPQL